MANIMINNNNVVENPFRILTINAANLGVNLCIPKPIAKGIMRPTTKVAIRAYGTTMLALANTTWPSENSHAGMKPGNKQIIYIFILGWKEYSVMSPRAA